jgi:hypothetical protein
MSFVSSLGTNAAGTILGFYDQDPVDEFTSGLASLTEAATHPGARSYKVWEESSWTMPARLPGRFYNEDSGQTAADKRLQEQGTFNILLDTPLDASILVSSGPTILGSLYFEYTVSLQNASAQGAFVGTSSQFDTGDLTADPVVWNTSTSVDSILDALASDFNLPTADPRSNAGVVIAQDDDGDRGFIVPPGVWQITSAALFTGTTHATVGTSIDTNFLANSNWENTGSAYEVNANFLGTPISAVSGQTPTPTVNLSGPTIMVPSDGVGTATWTRWNNWGGRVTVPQGQTLWISSDLNLSFPSSRSATLLRYFATFTLVWPLDIEVPIVSPASSDLSKRLSELERQISQYHPTGPPFAPGHGSKPAAGYFERKLAVLADDADHSPWEGEESAPPSGKHADEPKVESKEPLPLAPGKVVPKDAPPPTHRTGTKTRSSSSTASTHAVVLTQNTGP